MPYSTLAPRSPRASKTRSFLVGLGQMFLMSINIKNMMGGHLVLLLCFTLLNTWVWVRIVRLVIHSTRREIAAYMVGSALGAELGVLGHYYVLKPLALINIAAIL
jgi:hypothetical protein